MTRCSLGVGCDEYGVCYAAAHGQPEMCPAQWDGSGEAGETAQQAPSRSDDSPVREADAPEPHHPTSVDTSLAGELRHEVCELIEAYAPNRDELTGLPVGSEVEQLADLVLGAFRNTRQPPQAGVDALAGELERLREPSELPAAVELWFFRDLGETQRRQLFNICGYPGVEANGQILQKRLLRAILAALKGNAPTVSQPSDATKRMADTLGTEFVHDPKWKRAPQAGVDRDAVLEEAAQRVEQSAETHRRAGGVGCFEAADVFDWAAGHIRALKTVASEPRP